MDTSTDHIPLFPLSHGLFPDGLLPLNIFEPRYLDLIKRCHREQTPFGVVWLREGREVQVPGDTPSFFEYGCLAHIRRYTELQPALLQVLCQGGMRFELLQTTRGPYGVWQGDVRYIPADPDAPLPPQYQPLADRLGQTIAQAQSQGMGDRLPWSPPYHLDQCGWVANRYAEALMAEPETKVAWLREADPEWRLRQVAATIENLRS